MLIQAIKQESVDKNTTGSFITLKKVKHNAFWDTVSYSAHTGTLYSTYCDRNSMHAILNIITAKLVETAINLI